MASKDGVARALLELMTTWNNGQQHGSRSALAKAIAQKKGQSVDSIRTKIYRELENRPGWETVRLVVEHCAPPNGPGRWAEDQLGRLATIWYEARGAVPRGYIGSVIDARGETVRPAILEVVQASDVHTRAAVLEAKLTQAHSNEKALLAEVETLRKNASYFDDVAQQLHNQVKLMRTDTEELRHFAAEQLQPLHEQVEVLQSRVQNLQQDVMHAEGRAHDLEVENDRLHARRRQAEQELDAARADATRVDAELRAARTELNDATREIKQLRERLDQVEQLSGGQIYRPRRPYDLLEEEPTWGLSGDTDGLPPPVIDS